MTPKKAVASLKVQLIAQGRIALAPRIARAFSRIAARERQRSALTLYVARKKDGRAALRGAKDVLAELGAKSADVEIAEDGALIGGWRFEGRERVVDASWKKHLLDLYARATR